MVKKWTKVGEARDASLSFYGKKLVRQMLLDPKGIEHEFIFYALRDSVVVIPVTTDGFVLTVKEYKQGSDEVQQALVGGYCDPSEDVALTATREVREETGYQVGELIDLGHMWIVPRHSNGRVQLFLAKECILVGEQKLDDSEGEVEVVPVRLENWITMVLEGETTDSFSTVATTRALRHLGFRVQSED